MEIPVHICFRGVSDAKQSFIVRPLLGSLQTFNEYILQSYFF